METLLANDGGLGVHRLLTVPPQAIWRILTKKFTGNADALLTYRAFGAYALHDEPDGVRETHRIMRSIGFAQAE